MGLSNCIPQPSSLYVTQSEPLLPTVIVKSGKYTTDAVEKWSKKKIINTIFKSGISTADTLSPSAGRGVGMGIIKGKLDTYNGKLEIDSHDGEFCEFNIILPN